MQSSYLDDTHYCKISVSIADKFTCVSVGDFSMMDADATLMAAPFPVHARHEFVVHAAANYDFTGPTYCDGASDIGWPDGLVHRDPCHGTGVGGPDEFFHWNHRNGTGDGDIAPAINLGGEHCVAAGDFCRGSKNQHGPAGLCNCGSACASCASRHFCACCYTVRAMSRNALNGNADRSN